MVSAEEFAAINHILRKTMESYAPFGGVMILGTGDPKQLPPPQGRLLWTSPLIITSVRMFSLTKCEWPILLEGSSSRCYPFPVYRPTIVRSWKLSRKIVNFALGRLTSWRYSNFRYKSCCIKEVKAIHAQICRFRHQARS